MGGSVHEVAEWLLVVAPPPRVGRKIRFSSASFGVPERRDVSDPLTIVTPQGHMSDFRVQHGQYFVDQDSAKNSAKHVHGFGGTKPRASQLLTA